MNFLCQDVTFSSPRGYRCRAWSTGYSKWWYEWARWTRWRCDTISLWSPFYTEPDSSHCSNGWHSPHRQREYELDFECIMIEYESTGYLPIARSRYSAQCQTYGQWSGCHLNLVAHHIIFRCFSIAVTHSLWLVRGLRGQVWTSLAYIRVRPQTQLMQQACWLLATTPHIL